MNNRKQLVLIEYLNNLIEELNLTEDWIIKAEYSTNDNDNRVITIQEQSGEKIVFYNNSNNLFNYYMIDIYGLSIQECKELSVYIGDLIGTNNYFNTTYTDDSGNIYNEMWQIMFIQYSNPQAVEYLDIRRIGYNSILKCVINKIKSERSE